MRCGSRRESARAARRPGCAQAEGVGNMLDAISAKELDWYAEDDSVLIVDLRPRQEYRAGHIRGAVNVPQSELDVWLPDRRRTIVLYCDRGALSMAVARELADQGYRVKSVVGGFQAYRGRKIVRGWGE